MNQTNTFKQWLIHGYPYSAILALALSTLAALAISYGLSAGKATQERQQLLNRYGHNLAQLAANQLSIAMADKDLISLQALLNQLSTQDQVIRAVIYDLNNRILVESLTPGVSAEKLQQSPLFSHPISSDNSLIGSLVITMDDIDTGSPVFIPISFGLILLAMVIYSSARLYRKQSLYFAVNTATAGTHTLDVTSPETSAQPVSTANLKIETHLLINLYHIDKLYHQLDSGARQQQLVQIQTGIEQMLALYSGRQLIVNNQSILLGFSDKDATESYFKALCGGYLISTMACKQHWLPDTSIFIYCPQQPPKTTRLLGRMQPHSQTNKPSAPVFIARSCIENANLKERIDIEATVDSTTNSATDEPNHFVELTGFSPRYTTLLNNQLQRLLNAG
ncbi:MAG: hypothetical protein KTR20_05350 [Cellvibrionaceae bacterium]|nr:hypothetical protein [Cellvibrionaceae bacterium]